MRLRIDINMDNAAFEDEAGSEVARILKSLAYEFQARDLLPGDDDKQLYDINGNRVGEVRVYGAKKARAT